ncbi:helix-turn-helix domain-containing protein [Streptomyces sp. NPDC097610]|uniref:helix-turn-helix domain-containing protein n=1 Tax=Streptomyces sp. NPDC097610 TaxID=3157227 RepID=UPI00331E256B
MPRWTRRRGRGSAGMLRTVREVFGGGLDVAGEIAAGRYTVLHGAPRLREREDRPVLREALVAWAECGFLLVGGARRPAVHRNTLLYRLAEIEELSTRDVRDPRTAMAPVPGLPGRRTLTPTQHAAVPARHRPSRTGGRREAWAEKCCPSGRYAPGSRRPHPRLRRRAPPSSTARRTRRPAAPGRLAGPPRRRLTPPPPPHAPPHRNPHAVPPTPGVLRSRPPPRVSGPRTGPSIPPLTSAF